MNNSRHTELRFISPESKEGKNKLSKEGKINLQELHGKLMLFHSQDRNFLVSGVDDKMANQSFSTNFAYPIVKN